MVNVKFLYPLTLKTSFSCMVAFLLVFISIIIPMSEGTITETQQVIAGFENRIYIKPGEEYVIKYFPNSKSFSKISDPMTVSFSDTIKQALVKAPSWIRHSLFYQFEHLQDPLPYANLILESERKITDELSFCIAHAPLGNIAEPQLLLENVEYVYEIDKKIGYADIIEFNQNKSSYYSTIQYSILSGNKSITRVLPKEIYYWYIVHPQILSEHPSYIYDTFWRTYLVNHNDIGYPLLLEKMKGISYLWDEESYHQPKNREWTESISLHPTAVEAVSYWVGKTVPFQATGDRPGQPNLIAHQHNGWCGELQRIAVAGLRSVLVPSISVCNIAEDHVWRAFYDDGWHQNDNWWTDSGGTVDVPMVYSDNWGKEMSSVFSWRGDGFIYDVTDEYIHSEETVNVSFSVTDLIGHPIDGARVTVLVKGLKDITWYKNKALSLLQSFWESLPQNIRESIIDRLYDKMIQRIENVSDVIDGLTISIWNYTDADGVCSFTLGKNDEYVFLIQQPFSSIPFPLASWTTIRFLKNPVTKEFSIRFPRIISEKRPNEIRNLDPESIDSTNKIQGYLSVQSTGVQYQANVRNDDIGQYFSDCPISCFILNQENYNNYVNNRDFTTNYFKNGNIINDTFTIENDSYYFVFHNPNQQIISISDIQLYFKDQMTDNNVVILQPSTTIFDHPYFQIGDQIKITGISSTHTDIQFNKYTGTVSSGQWNCTIDTTHWKPGTYSINATCGSTTIFRKVTLLDNTLPSTTILSPNKFDIFNQGQQLIIRGKSQDNSELKSLSIGIDNSNWNQVSVTHNWTISLNSESLSPGIHSVSVRTLDSMNNEQIIHHPIVINDTIKTHKPIIHSITSSPDQITNQTNIVIYANISNEQNFPMKNVILDYKKGIQPVISKTMFEYGQHPIQSRHPEDPKKQCSNHPVYGVELGSLASNETIQFRVTAIDIANNVNQSSWQSIQVQ